MPLLETLTLIVGPAVANAVLKFWLRDNAIFADLGTSLVDALKAKGADAIAQHRGKRQFEEIGEKIAEGLLPVFEIEGVKLPEHDRNAVALMVADTLKSVHIKPALLVERNLDPSILSQYLLDANPTACRDFSEAGTELYRRVILDSSQSIIDIASQLPQFTERTFSEILKREDRLLTIASTILDEVRRMRAGTRQANSEADASRFETEYRRAVVRKLDELELFGVDASSASRRHRLSVAYITLSVEHKPTEKHDSFKRGYDSSVAERLNREPQDDNRDIMPVDVALARSNRLLIRGLAGSGKTTLLQWAAVRSASKSFGGSLAHLNNTLPFFVRLRQCVDFHFPAPELFPKLIAPAIAGRMPLDWVHQQLESGRAIVFVDGVDEVPESARQGVRDQLIELVQTYPDARFVVTSRPSAIAEGWLKREGFSDATLQPMQLPDILQFVKHWHDAVREELTDGEERAELEPLARNISKVIRRSSQINNLATSPLLCSMICALHRDRRKQIPSDRVELYEACSHMLIERRDLERGIELTDYIRLTYRQKTVFLKDLAYWFLNNGWSSVSVERAEERINRKLPNMPGLPPDASGSLIITLFVDRSGMIRKPVPDQVDFTHRTFQEFMAAQAILAEGDIGALIKNAHDDQWREAIILASGLANKKDREEIIKGIIKRGDKERKSQLYLLAMACIDASVELGEDTKHLAEQRLSMLVPPKAAFEVEALATAGELAVPYLSNVDSKPELVTLCIRTLAKIGGSGALDAIEEYSGRDQGVPRDEFVKAWSAFDGRDYAQRVLSKALKATSDLEVGSEALLEGFEFLPHLTSLKITKNFRLSDLDLLKSLTQLTTLKLPQCESLKSLKGINQFPNLTNLDFQGCKQLSDITGLENLDQLVEINLGGTSIHHIKPIAGLKKVTILRLKGCSDITDFDVLTGLSGLRELDLAGCSQLKDLKPIESLTELEALSLRQCRQLRDLTKLSQLTNLKKLVLAGCLGIKDISPITVLRNVEELDLSYADNINDLSPLKQLPNLGKLWLHSNVETFRRNIPALKALVFRGDVTM